MKIRADRAQLADTVGWVAQALDKNPKVPVLGGMKVTAADGVLTLAVFNYEVQHAATIEVEVLTPGECLVPGAFLATFTAALRGEEVELVLENQSLTINAGRSSYRTQTLPLPDYPTLPPQQPLVGSIAASDLQHAVAAARTAVSRDDMQPVLTALHLVGDQSGLHVEGTDRFRVVSCDLEWEHAVDVDLLPPCRSVEAAIKGLAGEVRIGAGDSMLSLAAGGRAVTIRMLDAEFPKLAKLVRTEGHDVSLTVEAHALAAAAVRCGKLADPKDPIALKVAPDSITVSVVGERGAGSEEIPCEADGSFEQTFHAGYLADALTALTDGTVTIALKRRSLAVIRPTNTDDRLALVMPRGDQR